MILNSLVSHGQAFKWECPQFTHPHVSVHMTCLYTHRFKQSYLHNGCSYEYS